jgi:hypothetical protein
MVRSFASQDIAYWLCIFFADGDRNGHLRQKRARVSAVSNVLLNSSSAGFGGLDPLNLLIQSQLRLQQTQAEQNAKQEELQKLTKQVMTLLKRTKGAGGGRSSSDGSSISIGEASQVSMIPSWMARTNVISSKVLHNLHASVLFVLITN